ncbi:MAG: cold-shock protein [Pseudomonadales bacterium]|nr:cold-shock protein [Pseudomonadales bacterium]
MPTGRVKWFSNAKGYGFIVPDRPLTPDLVHKLLHIDGELDFFAHFSSIQMTGFRTLRVGQQVTFDATTTDKGAHAVNIQPLDPDLEPAPDQPACDQHDIE